MQNTFNDPANASYPFAAWIWHDGRGGMLSTQIFDSGHVYQKRHHAFNNTPSLQELGVLPTSQANALLARCRASLNEAPSDTETISPEALGGETYQLVFAESETRQFSRHVARAALPSDTAMQTIRGEILGARNAVHRRWNIWTSAGARWFFLTLAVTVALLATMIYDMKHDNELQSRAKKTTATVIERGGDPHKSEFLRVRLPAEQGASEARIFKYLSHPNWEASPPGSTVDVLYDAPSGQAWLTADLLRWQSDKKTVWVIPGFLLLAALVGLAWLRRYQIGIYGDGEEYMTREDRVVTDDKDSAISRSTLLWFKMFI